MCVCVCIHLNVHICEGGCACTCMFIPLQAEEQLPGSSLEMASTFFLTQALFTGLVLAKYGRLAKEQTRGPFFFRLSSPGNISPHLHVDHLFIGSEG